jgi:hypothetical protein
MTALPRLPRPGGITIEVTIPQWLVLLLRMSIGLVVLGILGLILLSFAFMAFRGTSDGSDTGWTGPSMTAVAGDFSSRPVEYTVQLTAGSEEAQDLDKEWTLLLSSGAVHWANVVEGPVRLAPGETGTFVLTFLFDPQVGAGEPVSLRWDPGRKVNAWVLLER